MDVTLQICNSNSAVAWRKDALQTIKLDPAILEAHITVDKQSTAVAAGTTAGRSSPSSSEKSFGSGVKTHMFHCEDVVEDCSAPSKPKNFEEMMRMQKAALLSLAPHQFDLLLKYAEILRMQRLLNQRHLECAFCKNNGEPASWYSLHMLKDKRGRVRCPVLRGYRCRGCGATGDFAHTIKYCPMADRYRSW